MKNGFVKVAAATFEVSVADVRKNADSIIDICRSAYSQGVKLLVFPELSLCGASCGDLMFSERLLSSCKSELCRIANAIKDTDTIIIVGFPLLVNDKIYNCAAFCQNGEILGIVPKLYLNNSEKRFFAKGKPKSTSELSICGKQTVFGDMIFSVKAGDISPLFNIGIDIGTEAFLTIPHSASTSLAGATVIVNPFAAHETVGSDQYRDMMLSSLCARSICGYIHAGAGDGESNTDGVFGGCCAIYENGKLLSGRAALSSSVGLIISELDMGLISYERRRSSIDFGACEYYCKSVEVSYEETRLTRKYAASPFVPDGAERISARCEQILTIQAKALAARLAGAHARTAVIGISGGLDSCLAVLVAARAMDISGKSRGDIIGVTMPCFGTTSRTKSNAELLCSSLGTRLMCVDIGAAVRQHFSDIGHDEADHSVVYENAQARERTQVIMDIANMEGGLVVGTGDLSELALGWATYNGDHMSMYGVNGGVPKTLIRHIVANCADSAEADGNTELAAVLRDILDTPVSPELLPADSDGSIAQKTEDLVGPYEIHDFYIYYMLRYGFSPEKLYRIARLALGDRYSDEVLLKWLKNLIRRFFAQQFKRSCLPDGPKVGTVGVSPRSDLVMPSDASSAEWLREIDRI